MPLPAPLRSPKNVIALGLGFLIAIFFWLLSSPSSNRASTTNKKQQPSYGEGGPNELDRIVNAVRLARAWHATTTGRLGAELLQTEEEVVCPSDTHSVTRPLGSAGPGEVTEEFITTGNMLYAREAGQPWRSQPDAVPEKCKTGPSAGSQKLLTLLEPMKHVVRITEGPVIKLNNGTCRLWDLSGASNLPFHSICVEDATHLPRRLQVGGLLVEYSNWNQPVIIEPPEMPSAHPEP
jgi:hypothetical protein